MKLKHALTTAGFLFAATAAQAGPQFFFSVGGGGCQPQPVYCPPRPVYFQQPFYGPTVQVITYPAQQNCNPGFGTHQLVPYPAPVYRVQAPVYYTQPVQVYQGNAFGWRR